MRTAVYTRLSKDADGTSTATERQEKDSRAFASSKGWRVVEVFTDADVSAYSGKRRPSFERMLAAIADGSVGAVIVWRTDRLTRQPRDLERFVDACEAHKVLLASVTEPEFSGSGGLLMLRMLVSFASHESAVKSERVKRKKLELAERGDWQGGRRPIGYQRDASSLVIDRKEATEIRKAASAILAGTSMSAIARDWTRRRVGGRTSWGATRVSQVLTAPRLAGLRLHHGEVVGPASWEPILDVDDHRALVAMVEGRKRGHREPRNQRLLSGLVTCAKCGHNLSTLASGNYACSSGSSGCGRTSVRADSLDAAIAEDFIALVSDPELLEQLDAPETVDSRPLLAELRSAERRLEEIAREFGHGNLTVIEHRSARTPALARVEKAREALVLAADATVATMLPDAGEIVARWDIAECADRRRWIGALVDRVEVGPSSLPSRKGFDRDRATIVWRI